MLGEELKRRREEKGLSLSEISESTRIGSRFLKAIETESYGLLPGGLFTRSFIRTYAKQVGMDPDEAVRVYTEESGTSEHAQSDPTSVEGDDKQFSFEEPKYGLAKAAVAAGICAVILAFGGWKAYDALQARGEPAPPKPAVQPVAEAPAEVPASQTGPVAAPNGVTLSIEAISQCWIGYTVDAGTREQVMLKAGDTRTIAAAQSIDLSVGNTRAVNIRINNKDAKFPENTPVRLKKLTITPATASALIQP